MNHRTPIHTAGTKNQPLPLGILHEEQTPYQRIELHRDQQGLFLKLNGCPQVHQHEERLYHDIIGTMPLLLARKIDRIAILGGGDGLAARNMLEFPDVGQITLVELDGGMLKLCGQHPEWRTLTGGALTDPRLTVVEGDAIAWFLRRRGTFDVVLHDLEMTFTDQPEDLTIERCFQFFTQTFAKLSPGGVWALTIPESPDHALADGVFATYGDQFPPALALTYRRARSLTAKVRILLQAMFPHVVSWTERFPILGPHTTFYISNAPLTNLQRTPPPAFTVRKPLSRLR